MAWSLDEPAPTFRQKREKYKDFPADPR